MRIYTLLFSLTYAIGFSLCCIVFELIWRKYEIWSTRMDYEKAYRLILCCKYERRVKDLLQQILKTDLRSLLIQENICLAISNISLLQAV